MLGRVSGRWLIYAMHPVERLRMSHCPGARREIGLNKELAAQRAKGVESQAYMKKPIGIGRTLLNQRMTGPEG
jgi:hypothetical protein